MGVNYCGGDVQKWLGRCRRLGGSPKLWLLFLDVKIMGDKKSNRDSVLKFLHYYKTYITAGL